MALVIELLGAPRVVRDGVERRPRGRKTWALLAFLLLAQRPPARRRLAELLFTGAEDPLGALRWSLSDLRRLLGSGCPIRGDPVIVGLPPAAVVDVHLVRAGRWVEAIDLRGLDRELLEGVDVGSAAFELWLISERRRLDGAAEAVLHEAAQAALAEGRAGEAVGHARRLVERSPLEEAHHVLLVQCLRSSGDQRAAREHVVHCTALFRRELGVEPSQALHEAARTPPLGLPGTPTLPVRAMLEAGQAAIAAGATSQGMETLWAAAALARRGRDHHLLAQVLVALGHALVDAGKGGDEAGGAVLREAAARAVEAGDVLVAAAAQRDLAYADLQRGRYRQAREWAAAAAALAAGDDPELAWIEGIDGAVLSDLGAHNQALAALSSAVERADRAAAQEAAVYARTFLGRLHLLRDELPAARRVLTRAVRQGRTCWLAFSPLAESFLAEVQLRAGELEAAAARFERAFVMGCQLDDPCLESIARRGMGLVALARGQAARGYDLLVDAPRRSRRLPDSYRWIEAYGLDALCTAAIDHDAPAAPRWVADLERLASRCGMSELMVRALLHRARLGEPAALEAATEVAAGIDNPALHDALAAARGTPSPPAPPDDRAVARAGPPRAISPEDKPGETGPSRPAALGEPPRAAAGR